jgi:tripartite-type tricarboxylate transporter receptor subunit TctC
MKELVAEIRKRPGKLNFATVGEGTLQNFGPQYLFSLVGLPKDAAVGVPYKGSGELTVSLLGGQTQFACSNLGALLPHFRSGALRPLMTTTREPLKDLPTAPTARSLGWPQMESLAAWSALAGPPGLPREVVERWRDVFTKLARDPAWLAGVENLGGIRQCAAPPRAPRSCASSISFTSGSRNAWVCGSNGAALRPDRQSECARCQRH